MEPGSATTGSRKRASPKSSSFDACFRQHDVGGLEIAVHDAERVCRGERLGDLDGASQRLGQRQRPACEPRRKCFALEQLHHEERHLDALHDAEPTS